MYGQKIKEQLIYVLKNKDTERIKIGITIDIKSRVSTIQSNSGSLIELLYCSELYVNANYVEGLIHGKLIEYMHIGEWFNIDSEYAIKIVKEFTDKYGKIYKEVNSKSQNIIESYLPKNKEDEKIIDNIDFTKYKRIESGIYSDYFGSIFSIKYRIIDGKWIISKLKKLDEIQ